MGVNQDRHSGPRGSSLLATMLLLGFVIGAVAVAAIDIDQHLDDRSRPATERPGPDRPDQDDPDRAESDEAPQDAPGVATSEAGPRPDYFGTLAPGSDLPDGTTCAAWVRSGDVRPEQVPENAEHNQTTGASVIGATYLSQGGSVEENDFEQRLDGDFVGTTDQILEWGACKWGFDEDLVRAQAYVESSWYAGRLGDCGGEAFERAGGEGGCESVGILQVRSAEKVDSHHPGLFPITLDSTAMNVDYALAVMRLCYEGHETWLAEYTDDQMGYSAGNEWGCRGRWFTGSLKGSESADYLAKVQSALSQRSWESEGVGCPDWRENFHCSGLDLPVGE